MDVLYKKTITQNFHFFIGLILLLGLFWIFLSMPSFVEQNASILRLREMNECFKDGQIPCRWVPDLQEMYGYPLFNFHAPLPYYFGELFFLLTGNIILSVKIIYVISIIGSYIFVYLLTSKLWGKLGGRLSAFLYSFIVFALSFYLKKGIVGMWTLMLLAATFYFVNRLKERINLKNLLLFAVFAAFLLTSYDFSISVFLPVVLIFIALLFLRDMQIKFLWFSLMGLLLGFLLSSFYLWPMIFERNLISGNYLPIYAKEVPFKRGEGYEILTGDSKITDFNQGSNWVSFKTETNSYTVIRLHKYYFPEWRIFVDGKETKVEYKDNSMGLMTLILGKGNHTIYSKLYDTPIRLLSNLMTLLGIGISVILFLISFTRVRKWLLYYKKGIS